MTKAPRIVDSTPTRHKDGSVSTRMLPGTLSSFAIRPYRWYWTANVGFFAANSMQQVGQGWLVYDMTGDALALGGVSAAMGIAMVICSLLGGVIADRVVKRDLMIVTQIGLAFASLAMALLIEYGLVRYWHALVASMLTGGLMAFNMPARQSIVPDIVGDRQMANAVALNSSGMNLMRIAGPAIAGFAIELAGIGGVYFFMSLCYVFVVIMMIGVPRIPARPGQGKMSVISDVRSCFKYIFGLPVLMMLIGAEFVLVLVGMPYQILMPIVARDVLQVGASGLGMLLSAVGIGALVGSLAVATLVKLPHRGWMLLGAGTAFGAGLIGLASASSFEVALISLGIMGIGNASYFALNNGLVMEMVAREMRGRVMSVYMFTFGLQPLGAMPLSAIAGAFGAPLALAIGGSILTLGMVLIGLTRPAVRRLA